jgi:hypothetical protein
MRFRRPGYGLLGQFAPFGAHVTPRVFICGSLLSVAPASNRLGADMKDASHFRGPQVFPLPFRLKFIKVSFRSSPPPSRQSANLR